MKKLLNLILLCFITTVIFSQSAVFEKYASVDTLTQPYIDKIEIQFYNKIQLTEEEWRLYQFNKLETFDSDFIYNVYGMITVNNFNLLLVERNYAEESNHWAVFIKDDKIYSHLNLAYQNSEGFLYIESEINADQITIKETSDFGDKTYSEKVFTVTDSGFIKK